MRINLLNIIIIWLIESISLLVLARLSPYIDINNVSEALLIVAAIGLANSLVWPILLRVITRFNIVFFVLAVVILNGLMVAGVINFVSDITIQGVGGGILVTFWLTTINIVFSTLFSIDKSHDRVAIKRLVERYYTSQNSDTPGIVFLEIDGLSRPVLDNVIEQGYVPTLARWLESGSHRVVEWECDWSSQTSASQAGILHGNNHNMPAFRWYERDTRRTMVSNHPKDTAAIEQRISNGAGLLANGGGSISNMFSGDATFQMMTVSQLINPSHLASGQFYIFFANAHNFARVVILSGWDIVLELVAAWRQRHRDEHPRGHRGGVYPFIRAFTTIISRELTVYNLMATMFAGLPAMYTTFVGYDEVAHHSGIQRPDALDVLRKLDEQIARIEEAAKHAPRPYHFVVLSDHGQSQGATFKQRHDMTLEEYVQKLLNGQIVSSLPGGTEGWGHLNSLLTTVIHSETSLPTKVLRRAIQHRTDDGVVVLGPEHSSDSHIEHNAPDDVIVLASGNLGLIYFKDTPERLTLEQINQHYPHLISGLIQHESIGFILVRSQQYGALAMGARGVHYLDENRIEGEDPLAVFGANAKHHLLRTDSFLHVADIMVNSIYDPATGEVAAFEELIGSHGGLGGNQTRPFLLFPASFSLKDDKIVGAESIHHVLCQWIEQQ